MGADGRPVPPRWLLRKPSADAPARVFCFPYAGCGASMYRSWPSRIGPAEVCLLQPPGRETRLREPHYGTYEALAEALVEFLRPYLDRPFAFFGHCSGALPGFEAARQLARCGLPAPARLFVSSEVAPHDGPYGRFLSMTDEELAPELEALVAAMGGQLHPSLLRLSLGVLRADIEANKRYRYDAPVRIPGAITAIGWKDDDVVGPELMDGWRSCSNDVRFVLLDGAHYSFLQAPETLLAEIATDMERATAA